MRITHVITDLDVGGAELMLYRLIKSQSDDLRYRHNVISLTGTGVVGEQMRALGVELTALGMSGPLDIPRVTRRIMKSIRAVRPDIVQTWMYHADLLGGLAARLAGHRNLIWGVRGTAIPQRRLSATQTIVSLCSRLSHVLPRVIVCCAESARVAHAAMGYDRKKLVVIPNGYDLARFRKDPLARGRTRAAFGFTDEDVVVGIVGRFDPLKDYRNFVLAASALASRVDRAKFLMIGRGVDSANSVLNGWIAESGCSRRFVLAGERSDIPECLAGMDVFCLSSRKEGFPNVVCEAMAMNVPCVVTDAGDAAEIVSDTGIVVPPCDAAALADALSTMIGKGRAEWSRLGGLARRRIEEHYSMETASSRFEDLYDRVVQTKEQIRPSHGRDRG